MFDAEYEARLSPTKRSPQKQDKKTSPAKEIYSDRFIPSRSINLRESFSLLSSDPIISDVSMMSEDVAPSPPKLSSSTSSIYQQVLQNELLSSRKVIIKDEPEVTASPPRDSTTISPVKRRLFTYRSESETHLSLNGSTEHVINLRTSDSEALISTLSPITQASQRLLSSPPKCSRKIAKTPFKVLQAPSIRDDFYLNVLDWGGNNQLAVALGRALFLWNATTCQVRKVTELDASDTIASVHWLDLKAHLIAIGTARGHVHIWDLVQERCVRTMSGHKSRVGTLAWWASSAAQCFSSGSRDRHVLHRDLREARDWTCRLAAHKQEVCGLKWSALSHQLASGGNDNKLAVWDPRWTSEDTPLFKFEEHVAAVKAIAWSPHQRGLLASGGGTADRAIKFWTTLSDELTASLHDMSLPQLSQPRQHGSVQSIDTGSQICNLLWSTHVNELVSTHGYSQNQITVWSYPSMHKLATLTGHTMRVLYLALSPDGQTIVTGAGDETLRFWNVFPAHASSGPATSSKIYRNEIR